MDCDKFSKLDMINDIRNYFNKLVKNTKNDNIKFFSNIELGKNKDNPHVHIQVWHEDQKQIDKIYDKVISRFGLFSEFCRLDKQKNDKQIFQYVIKDYNKSMSDEQLLKLDDKKRIFRGVLGKKIRFSSHSKGRYTKAIYKSLYSKFDLKKDTVDLMLDNCIINVHGNVNNRVIEFLCVVLFTIFITKSNKSKSIECFECWYKEFRYSILFEWWTYGKLKNINNYITVKCLVSIVITNLQHDLAL